jgi:glycerol uptake facilitator-like aquaporin
MKTHRKVAWILALIVTIIVFGVTFIQSPTANPARALGQFLASAGIGIIVFLVSYAIGALVIRIRH